MKPALTSPDGKPRCSWSLSDPLLMRYHDEEWGVVSHDDCHLFEHLTLETAQAGLSWLTVLRKREAYREAFAHFDPALVAAFGPDTVESLLQNQGIIRNRLKIMATISNAEAFLVVQKEFGSFDAYQWQFVQNTPKVNAWKEGSEVPAITPEAVTFSKDLKKRGFRFVGPTTIYAHMQSIGMVNDHTIDCYRYDELIS